jgi:hypothetical protein
LIHLRIEHNDEVLDRHFDDTVALVTFLDIAAYYVQRRGLDELFRRFNRRKTGPIGPVLEERYGSESGRSLGVDVCGRAG